MDEIKIIHEKDYDDFTEIIVNAYPGEFGEFTDDDKDKMKERLAKEQKDNKTIDFYGLYRENQLLGVQRLHDFTMNMKGERLKVGGVGLVAVDLVHKKEGVAKGLITYFLKQLQEENVSMAILYPFRADFYKKMGFGYGTKMNLYYFKPTSLPRHVNRKNVFHLTTEDILDTYNCYMEFFNNNHGMVLRNQKTFEFYFKNKKDKIFVGYKSNNNLSGYLMFRFMKVKTDNFIYYDIVIEELIYNNSEALLALC